jgi:hypothetical protein
MCLAVSFCFAVATVAQAEGKVRLFILSGQSNMAGLNPDASFTPAVTKEFPGDEVIVVKYAIGGQPIRRWFKEWKLPEGAADTNVPKSPAGDMYDKLMTMVREAVGAKQVDSVAFVWMQGENDAKRGWHSVYAAALSGVCDQLRADLKRDDLAVVIGRLSDNQKGSAAWDAVRAAQESVAAAEKYGAWVDTDDLNDSGNKNLLHYTKDGYAELGRRFATEAAKLMRKAEAAAAK